MAKKTPDAPEQQVETGVVPTQFFAFVLIVTNAFDNYRRGDHISDSNEIATILENDNAHHCVKVARS